MSILLGMNITGVDTIHNQAQVHDKHLERVLECYLRYVTLKLITAVDTQLHVQECVSIAQ